MKTKAPLLITYPSSHTLYIKGFTLLELLVVIFIISISTAIIMPSIWRTREDMVKNEVRHLSTTLRYVHDMAVSSKETFVFRFNLDNDIYAFKIRGEARTHKIHINDGLQDVIIPSIGKVSEGEVIVDFGPLGPDEPITVHIGDKEVEYTIFFNNLTGRTRIYEGYKF
jgi:prepilin-type N-terminal cleavage/methylation domain-containing protein